jgi:hypothetical protein
VIGVGGLGDEQRILLLLAVVATTSARRTASSAETAIVPRAARNEATAVMPEHRPRRRSVGLVVAVACVLVTAPPVLAQPPVRIVGVVQWVSSTSMAVMSNHGDSIMIDLMEADQSTYRGLRAGDWVFIDGTLAPDRRHVIARDIWRDDNRGAWTQAP